MLPAPVVIRDLCKRYGGVEALRGVSFTAARGEILGLLGPNGAGKTTTLECLTGLREADTGEISVNGIDLRRAGAAARSHIGVVLQGTALPAHLTPREALALFGAFYEKRAEPAALLARFALADKADAPFDTLSGGQRQRLALALAFVNQPDLIVLDEPSTGLDPQARRELHAEILRMKADGHTVILSTHDLTEAGQLCDRLVILWHGRVIASGTSAELIARSAARQTVTLVTRTPLSREQLASVRAFGEIHLTENTVRFMTDDGPRAIAALMALVTAHDAGLLDLQVRQASLEDVFHELIDDQAATP